MWGAKENKLKRNVYYCPLIKQKPQIGWGISLDDLNIPFFIFNVKADWRAYWATKTSRIKNDEDVSICWTSHKKMMNIAQKMPRVQDPRVMFSIRCILFNHLVGLDHISLLSIWAVDRRLVLFYSWLLCPSSFIGSKSQTDFGQLANTLTQYLEHLYPNFIFYFHFIFEEIFSQKMLYFYLSF